MTQATLQLRVCIDVDDLQMAITFYTNALGLIPGRRLGQSWAELLGGPVPIDLLAEKAGTAPAPGVGAPRDYRRHWTPVHLDWPVPDLDAAVQRAQAAGATLEGGVREKKWGRLAVLADPFGNGFCFLEYRGRGYDELIGG